MTGEAGGGEQRPEHAEEVGRALAGDVEDEGQADEGEDDAHPGEAVRGAPGDEPHPEDDEDDAEVLDEQGDPDGEPPDGLEVAELGRGDGQAAVAGGERQLAQHVVQPVAHLPQPDRQQEGAGPGDAHEDDGARAPARLDEGLGEGAGRAERRAREDEGHEPHADVPPHRLHHAGSFRSDARRPGAAGAGAGAVRSQLLSWS